MGVVSGFENVYGHENVKAVLNAAIHSGRIGHAYIFTGKRGVGKRLTASVFAKMLVETSACEHPDIITVTNEWADVTSKSNTLMVETVKKMRRDIYIKPYSSKRKVYIVPNADTMNIAAQNSLLKVFEEPPLYCTIILLAENSSKFLPTILSRANEIRFNPLTEKMVSDYLVEKCGMSADDAALRSVMSGGCIGSVLELVENDESESMRNETISKFMDLLASENRTVFVFSSFLKSHKDDMDFVISVLKSFLNDFLHAKFGSFDEIVNTDKTDEIKRLNAAVSKNAAVQFLNITLKYERVISSNANFRMAAFFMACEYWEEIHGRNYRSSI